MHLKFELCLLIALTVLTISSLQGLYKDSFGLPGDYIFIILVFLRLSRHVVFRLLCTWDPSTHATPTLLGLLSHFLTAHVTAGQVHDRPFASVVSRLNWTTNQDATRALASSWGSLLPSSLVYAWQIPTVCFWLPQKQNRLQRERDEQEGSVRVKWIKKTDSTKGSYSRIPRTELQERIHQTVLRAIKATRTTFWRVWVSYAPSLQCTLVACVVALAIGSYLSDKLLNYSESISNINTVEWNMLAMENRREVGSYVKNENWEKARGAYSIDAPSSWWSVVVNMSNVGYFLSLIMFLRLEFPLPDLVAGSGSVLKDASRKGTDSSSSSRSFFSSPSYHHHHHHHHHHRTSKQQDALLQSAQETPFSERVRSITSASRLWLTLTVIICRCLENILLCGILPRTRYICRVTGHCPDVKIPPWEMNKIFFPVGISSPYRDDGLSYFGFMETDLSSALWTMSSILITTIVLLTAHALITNRSYLAILGFLAGDWEPVSSGGAKHSKNGTSRSETSSSWDPRKRYKKGDVVSYTGPGEKRSRLYRAATDQPDGKPMDLLTFSRTLQTELGHPYTSKTVSLLATLQLWLVLILLIRWMFCSMFCYSTHGMLVCLAASIIVFHSLVTVGATDYDELEILNEEIIASVEAS